MTQRKVCPSCAEITCSPSGHSQTILIVGESPSPEDMKQGRPFSTTMDRRITGAKVLRKELERLGVSLQDFRVTYLYLHEPTDNENCYQAGMNNVLEEAKGKQAILLVGPETVEAFTQYKVSDVSGLQVESAILSAPIIYAVVNPSMALARSVGEVRFGITAFVKRLEQENLL